MADGERNPDYTDVSQESAREAVANTSVILRAIARDLEERTLDTVADQVDALAERLGRAVQRMDEEKASDPKFILRETAEAYNDGCADGLDSDSAHDMAMGVLAGLLGLAPEPGPLEEEKASQRP